MCSTERTLQSEQYFFILFLLTKNIFYRTERILNESGTTVAPPPRTRLATSTSLPAHPTQLPHQTRQRRPGSPVATQKRASGGADSESSETESSDASTDHDANASSSNDDEGQSNDEHDKYVEGDPNAGSFLQYIPDLH